MSLILLMKVVVGIKASKHLRNLFHAVCKCLLIATFYLVDDRGLWHRLPGILFLQSSSAPSVEDHLTQTGTV
jgi:hypothetical protein